MNWLHDDLWLAHSKRWFLPPPPRFFVRPHRSAMNLFFDHMYPGVDRLSPTSSDDDILDLYSNIKNLPIQSKTFNREYEVLNSLGKGGFGQVYDGRRRSDNKQVVMKFLPKNRILNWGTFAEKRIPFEIEILWRLRDLSGIIQIFEHFEEPDRFIFTMEKIPNSCTLFHIVMENPSLANTELLRHIFREMIRINILLQMCGIWHRDCKPENILYCKNDRTLRFIDFGSAAPVQSDDFTEFQGTLEIMTPEWILENRYNGERSCVWALGVCLYFLLFKQYPFRTKAAIVNGRTHLPFSSSADKQAYHTMKQCLNMNEYRRPKLDHLQYLSWLD